METVTHQNITHLLINQLKLLENILYRLKQVDIDGTFEYSDEVEVNLGSPNKL